MSAAACLRSLIGGIDEKIIREEHTLDWSQSKTFLVAISVTLFVFQLHRVAYDAAVYF